MRYTSNARTKLGDKYLTSKILHLKPSTDDQYIISRDGDRLDLIANDIYGDEKYWFIIAAANNLGKGTFEIPAGLQIRLPRLPIDILQLIEDNNRIR